MRRLSVLVPILALALVSVFALGNRLGTTAQEDALTSAGQGFVGTWALGTADPDRYLGTDLLATLGSDGTVLLSSRPLMPARVERSGTVFLTVAHGTWESMGDGTVALTVLSLPSVESGNQLGVIIGRATLHLDLATDRLTGTYATEYIATRAIETENVITVDPMTVEGVRVAVDPLVVNSPW